MKRILTVILMLTLIVFSASGCITQEDNKKEYSVTFDSDGGSKVDTITVTEGNTATKPADPTKNGFTFGGWYLGETKYNFSSPVTDNITLKASWVQITYTVTFDSDNGSGVESQTVAEGSTPTKPTDPIKTGFNFGGWYLGETKYDFSSPVTDNITLKASWVQITYTVTFDSDGGSGVESQTVTEGSTPIKPTDPIKIGYTFDGWYLGETKYDFTSPVTESITLKASWEQNFCEVTFDSDGGSDVESQTVAEGSTVTEPQNPTKAGFLFLGWYNGDDEYDFTAAVKTDLLLKAKWTDLSEIAGTWTGTESVYTITNDYSFVINADTTITATYKTSGSTITMNVTPISYKNNTLTIKYTTSVSDEEKEMVFTYANNALTTASAVASNTLKLNRMCSVSFDSDGGSKVSTQSVAIGSTARKPSAPSKDGHNFDGWYLGDEPFDFDNTPITSDITLTAHWTVKEFSVRFYNQDNKLIKTIKVKYGSLIPLEEVPTAELVVTKEGFEFSGKWQISSTDTTEYDFNSIVKNGKYLYPIMIEPVVPVSNLQGTWSGTEIIDNSYGSSVYIETNEYVFVIDADGKVTATRTQTTTSNTTPTTETLVISEVKFNGITLTVNYTLGGSNKTLKFTYDSQNNTLQKSGLTLTKQA